MSFRQIRTTAPDPLAVQQLIAGEDSNNSSNKQNNNAQPSPIATSHAPPASPSIASSPSASSSGGGKGEFGLPSNFNLMTERQQMAFLMRATSEGDKKSNSSLMAAKRKEEEEEDDDDDEDEDEDEESEGEEGGEGQNENGENSEMSDAEEEDGSDSSDSSLEDDAPAPVSSSRSRISAPLHPSAGVSSTVVLENDHLPRLIRKPLEYPLWNAEKQKKWDGINKNPNAFYYAYLAPGLVARSQGSSGSSEWSDKEREIFLWSLEAYPPEGMWGLFSLNVPGRTGAECEAFFKLLLKQGKVSVSAAKKNQPAVIKVETKAAGKKHQFESTPFIVARAAPSASGPKSGKRASAGADAEEELKKLNKELETAIAQLSLVPPPGTAGLKLQVHFRTEASDKPSMLSSKKISKKEQKEMDKENVSASSALNAAATPTVPSTPTQAGRKARNQSGGEFAYPSALVPPAAPSKGKQQQAQTPSTPSASTPGGRRSGDRARNWGSGSNNEHGSGSSADRRLKAANELLQGDMMDLSDSPAGAEGEQRSVPNSRKRSNHAATSESLSSSMAPPIVDPYSSFMLAPFNMSDAASIPGYKPLFPEHAVEQQAASVSPEAMTVVHSPRAAAAAASSTPATASILPFPSFSIPAHTPFVSAKRQKLLTAAPCAATRLVRQAATPVQTMEAPWKERKEVGIEIELDEKEGGVRLREMETGKLVTRAPEVAAAAASSSSTLAAAAASSSSSSFVGVDPSDCSSDDPFQSYSLELAKLESQFRLKMRRLASHQSQQLERIKSAYGIGEQHDESACMHFVRLDSRPSASSSSAGAGVQTHSAFLQPVNQFTAGCRQMLRDYFNKDVESSGAAAAGGAEPIQTILSRCRTFGEAVLEIRLSYKSLMKELQREHSTGRDVLNSLKTAGLLI